MVAIFVAFMFVSLVLVDLGVEKWRAWRHAQTARATRPAAGAVARALGAWCEVPEGVHFASQHIWIKPDPAGGLAIGADPLIAHAVGAVARIILPKVGEQVTAGQPLFRFERGGRAVTIPSALTGRVMAVNSRLAEQPELLSSDPYGSGWICCVNPSRADDASSLRFGEQAALWLENEIARFREFIFAQVTPDMALGLTSPDGGLPALGCLGELGPAAWSAFEANFLQQS